MSPRRKSTHTGTTQPDHHHIDTTLVNDADGKPWRVGYHVLLAARLEHEPDRKIRIQITAQEIDALHARLTELRAQHTDREEY